MGASQAAGLWDPYQACFAGPPRLTPGGVIKRARWGPGTFLSKYISVRASLCVTFTFCHIDILPMRPQTANMDADNTPPSLEEQTRDSRQWSYLERIELQARLKKVRGTPVVEPRNEEEQ